MDILLRGFLKMLSGRKLQEASPDHPVNHDGDPDHKSEAGDDQDCKDVVLDVLNENRMYKCANNSVVKEYSLKGIWFMTPRFRVKMKFTERDKISLKGTHSFSKGDGH